jgi:hypothetical protein
MAEAMTDENVEAMEHATDIYWQMACADLRLLARGVPLADFEEEDDGRASA